MDTLALADLSQQSTSPRPVIVVLGALLASVWSLSQIYMAETTGSYVTGEGAFVSTSLLAWLCLSLALRLAPVDFVALFAIVEGASASSVLLPALVGLPIAMALPTDLNWGDMFTSLPPLLRPNRSIATLAALGGAPVPFASLLPTILFAVAINSLVWISLSAQMFLLRERLYSLRTVSYPIPSATHSLVKEAVSGTGGRPVGITMFSGFSLGFLLVSFTEGYLSSMLLGGLHLLPAGLTDPIYGLAKQVLPGSLLGLDIATSIPYIWFLLFVPSAVSATVSIAGAVFYLLVLPLEFQLKFIPDQFLQSYTTLFSASRSFGVSSLWTGMGLFLASAAGIFLERARVPRTAKDEASRLVTALTFLVPPALLAWALGGSALLLAVVLVMALLSASAWSARGLAELNLAFAPSEVIVGGSWPLVSKTLGVKSICNTDSMSFFLGGYLAVASSVGAATSLESVKFGELLDQRPFDTLSYFILGSLIGLILGPVLYLWLLFRLGAQSRILGGRVLGMVEEATGIYSARSYLVDHALPLNIDYASLSIGCVVGLGLPFLLASLSNATLSPYALALGVFMNPAGTIIPYALVSTLRYLLFERRRDAESLRPMSTFAVGLAAGSVSAALLSTILSTLS